MSKRKKTIEEFFSKYEANYNNALKGDDSQVSETVKPFFADCFVGSSPAGVKCGQNNDEFIESIKQGFQFYKSIGSTGMSITSKEITLIDDLHSSAKIYWHYTYNKDGHEGAIDFHNVYFMSAIEGELKIFAFITADEQKALKEHGLVPQEAAA